MNSAAKLRTRGIAAIGATALIATSFGPAAMAWVGPTTAPTAANQAGAASIGLIDADDNTAGTQGATVVAPGQTGAAIGDVRFVIPNTFRTGDYIEFTLGDGDDLDPSAVTPALPDLAAQNAWIAANRVSFVAQPQVTIDSTPYAETTHVQSTSPATGAEAGSVEAGLESRYAGPGVASAPNYTVSMRNEGDNQYQNVIRITFNRDADPAASGAKFIGAINGATINVGSSVAPNQDLGLTARSFNANDSAADAALGWFGASTTLATPNTHDRTTYPATIATARLDVTNGTVVADGSAQYVGPVTVTSSAPMTGAVRFSVAGGTFDRNAPVTATAYNAAGALVGTATAGNASFVDNNTISYTPGAGAVRVVFSGMALSTEAGQLTYTLVEDGVTGSAPTGTLGSNTASNFAQAGTDAGNDSGNRNQIDIIRPTAATQVSATTTVVPTRIGGTNRYETAVKVAEADRGSNSVVGMRGEADNVVIASGETFPDALSAGYLAATKDAPILLTQRGLLPQEVKEFLKNYGAKNVYVVGGEAAVSAEVQKELASLQSYDVQAKQQTRQVETTVSSGTYATGGTATAWTTTNAAGDATNIAFTDVPSDSAAVTSGITFTLEDTNTATGAITPRFTTNLPGATTTIRTAPTTTDTGEGTVTVNGVTYNVVLPAITDNTGAPSPATSTPLAATGVTQRTITTTENVPGSATDRTATGDVRQIVPLNTTLQVTRIAGANRFETNRRVNEYAGVTSTTPIGTMVAQYGQPAKKTALIANGLTPWDSLAAGPLVGNGAGNPIPLVLTAGDSLHSEAKRQMQTMDIAHAILIGGDTVVPGGVSSELTGLGTSSTRLSGADRWGTARAITDFALRSSAPSTTNTQPGLNFGAHSPLLANGGAISMSQPDATKWADALTSGAWAARTNSTIALTTTNELPEATKDMLTQHAATFSPLIAIGLGHAVSTEVLNAANALVGN